MSSGGLPPGRFVTIFSEVSHIKLGRCGRGEREGGMEMRPVSWLRCARLCSCVSVFWLTPRRGLDLVSFSHFGCSIFDVETQLGCGW